MNYVSKGNEKLSVSSKADAISLMRMLNENGCTENVRRQEVIGKNVEMAFMVCYGEESIGVCTQEDGEMALNWLLSLGLDEVTVKRAHS